MTCSPPLSRLNAILPREMIAIFDLPGCFDRHAPAGLTKKFAVAVMAALQPDFYG